MHMKLILNLLVLLAPAAVFAAGGGHGDGHIPTSTIMFQAINLTILFAAIIYFTKDAIVSFFAGRKAAYLEAAQKSAFAREQAEKEFVDIKNKLANLDQTREENLRKAQTHAEDLKKQILEEANDVTKRIKNDAELTARLEVQRAQKELRTQLLQDSVEAARIVLTKDLGSSDQQKLQKDFINNVGV
ncbi:ATP synthase B chain [Bdellovibrio bacteriovorus HD100]|uniref:ATP synthase subunit b n=2 Tax=Bdellovibrio bacteriovorus TaxID=959 RepID=ATPF_BDEBA|nr:RecName: Full=ATP synthase subunit b; AltName: Full=ATP synthase F(0) sector subunit b; AltName: Full=ATPase subunit I; AltName: Full=F-type ATPase subunit b; Short=F-ATPase subunit b [Bdellovibrio bacteriovorus HD100]AHZ85650.1 ATP synthase subunit B [Bdellovibrio bacteriovorus]CAE81256.1 ATP synthase B chain [Bdellovibrio bacteriovorus HD100]